MRVSSRQIEVLKIIVDFSSECWGDVWSHCNWRGASGLAFANFDRVADALVRNGLVTEGDQLEITERGRLALRLDASGILKLAKAR